MNEYRAFYNGRVLDVLAGTSYLAQLEAARQFKIVGGNSWKVSVVLVTKNNVPVVHSTAGL